MNCYFKIINFVKQINNKFCYFDKSIKLSYWLIFKVLEYQWILQQVQVVQADTNDSQPMIQIPSNSIQLQGRLKTITDRAQVRMAKLCDS